MTLWSAATKMMVSIKTIIVYHFYACWNDLGTDLELVLRLMERQFPLGMLHTDSKAYWNKRFVYFNKSVSSVISSFNYTLTFINDLYTLKEKKKKNKIN